LEASPVADRGASFSFLDNNKKRLDKIADAFENNYNVVLEWEMPLQRLLKDLCKDGNRLLIKK